MSFTPNFTVTPRLLKVLEEIAVLHAKVQSASIGVRWIPLLQKEAGARLAHGSTGIEGNPLTLEQVEILAEGGQLPSESPRSVQEIWNYLAALRFIAAQAKANRITGNDIRHLHGLIGQKNALDRGPIGEYRPYGVRVGRHVAPNPLDVPALMGDLLIWLNGPAQTWPAVIGSAILHYRFEFIHPFGDGNGRVGRLLATWELYRRQFDTHHIFAVDEILLEDRQGYYRALREVEANGQDLSHWIEYIAGAVLESIQRVWRRISAIGRAKPTYAHTLTPKQETLLALLHREPKSIVEIQAALRVTKPGAHYILKPLLKLQLVSRKGGHKTGKYYAL